MKRCSVFAWMAFLVLGVSTGGMAASEALKITGKLTPIQQWFHVDALDLAVPHDDDDDETTQGSRYDGQLAILGPSIQNKLSDAKVLLIGAGITLSYAYRQIFCTDSKHM